MIGMVSGWVSFYLDRHKHRQEVQSMKRDNQLKEMELAKKYVDEYDKTIAERLRTDVKQLRNDLNQMRHELEKLKKNVCYRPNCHRRISGMLNQPEDDNGDHEPCI
jgi:hypothetical protein